MRSNIDPIRRIVLLLPLFALLVAIVPVASGVPISGVAWAQDPAPPAEPPATPPPQPPKVDVTVETREVVWYTEPVWIAVGASLLILIVALIVASSRSSSTTVVK